MSLTKCLRKRTVENNRFHKLETTIKTVLDCNETDVPQLLFYKSKLIASIATVTEGYYAIFENCADEELDVYTTEFDEINEKSDSLFISIQRVEEKLNASVSNTQSKIGESDYKDYKQCREIKLPNLELPSFSGAIEDWISFSDLFTATVHENSSLSDAQKLQYLKSVLKGDASKIIQSMPIQNSNYAIAWDLLAERYSNKRELIFAHIKKLISQPNIREESATAILNLVDTTNECVRVLEVLGQSVKDFSEILIVYIIQQKLDCETKQWWERNLKNSEVPSIADLTMFLKNHARALQVKTSSSVRKPGHQRIASFTTTMNGMQQCVMCHGNHGLFKCLKFVELSVENRVQTVKNNKLCFNCFGTHRVDMCRSKRFCSKCGKRHNSLLHYNHEGRFRQNRCDQQSVTSSDSKSDESLNGNNANQGDESCQSDVNNPRITSCFGNVSQYQQAMLATALINVKSESDDLMLCRLLIDPGSEANFITEAAVQRLGLKKKPANLKITCLGSGTSGTTTQGVVQIKFSPHFDSRKTFEAELFVLKRITGHMPHSKCDSASLPHLRNIVLADPKCFEPGQIDILLGVSMSFSLLGGEKIFGKHGTPFAINSELGWLIAGNQNSFERNPKTLSVNCASINTDEIIKKFWELESIPAFDLLTEDERMSEEYFEKTHYRDDSGRYVVRLPFKANSDELGNSKSVAVNRFLKLEKRLSNQPETLKNYKLFMQEYLDLGHMEKVPLSIIEKPERELFYMPHHPVIKESSSTTKLRVVFDASAKSSSGVSLNDNLLVGSRIQQDLFFILLRFRTHPVVMTADINKMYRQIKMNSKDVDFQRIVWRNDPSELLCEYRLSTVTYGTACAPFLATRVLKQLAIDEATTLPEASKITLRDFYVDDLLTGSSTVEEAIELTNQLRELMKRGGLELRKWTSNECSVLENIPPEQRETSLQLEIEKDCSIKVLGITWHPSSDKFRVRVTIQQPNTEVTKRTILSEIARIFDPMGWLAPFVVSSKIILQQLWSLELTWDEPVPETICSKWIKCCNEMSLLKELSIPRAVLLPSSNQIELHGFCDSSEKAYGAVLYLRSVCGDSMVSVKLLVAKTRVAPLKSVSLPRLELCAAVLLAHLLEPVTKALQLKIDKVYAWTDSTVALSWMRSEPKRWQTFVANRVAEIQRIIPIESWNHIQGKENPADSASRGLSPSELIDNKLWWCGPQWLSEKNIEMPTSRQCEENEQILKEERKRILCTLSQVQDELPIISKSSSYIKLQRIIAWCLRFVKNTRKKAFDRKLNFLSRDELNEAEICLVRVVQSNCFHSEIQCIKSGKQLSRDSKIINLCPFIDSDNLLRVGGRLRHSKLPENRVHPMMLPKKHHLTTLIVKNYHVKYLHAGPQLLLASIQQKFWIIGGRDLVRKTVKECMTCFRLAATTANQRMADLPSTRVTPSRPFTRTGVDYAGPFTFKANPGRGQRVYKCYIAIFVCFSTRAIHLEIVTDLSTQAFIAALKRFISRRGKPTEITSDCGTNFIGASRELKATLRSVASSQGDVSVATFMASEGVQWSFNPPAAPHFGGLWEAGVKSMKYHLKRIVGNSVFTLEEFFTVTAQIEACLNSRPLCPVSSDPSDLSVLTPGHFLIGAPLTALPEPDQTELPISRLGRWQLVQRGVQHFWKRWSTEYLSRLQQRPRWCAIRRNIQVGDLVLLKGEHVPALRWKLGRVQTVYPGTDGNVRVVIVKTDTSELKRPISKLCLLPFE